MHSHLAAVFVKRRALDIGPELSLGLFLREADIVAAHRSLAANLTFSHNFTLFKQIKSDRKRSPGFDVEQG